jgi:hypothetical protein
VRGRGRLRPERQRGEPAGKLDDTEADAANLPCPPNTSRLLVRPGPTVSHVGEFDDIIAAMEASPLMAEVKAMGVSGDFSKLDRNAAKRHHYVPQFLLRGFADPGDGGRRIFQMPTRSRKAPRAYPVRSVRVGS